MLERATVDSVSYPSSCVAHSQSKAPSSLSTLCSCSKHGSVGKCGAIRRDCESSALEQKNTLHCCQTASFEPRLGYCYCCYAIHSGGQEPPASLCGIRSIHLRAWGADGA